MKLFILSLGVFLCAIGCAENSTDSGAEIGSDTDSDADTVFDTDADSDADGDSDTDADADSDSDMHDTSIEETDSDSATASDTGETPPLIPRCAAMKHPARDGDVLVHPGGTVGPEELRELWSSEVMAGAVRAAALAKAIENAEIAHAGETAALTDAALIAAGNADYVRAGERSWLYAVLFEATCDEKYAQWTAELVRAWADNIEAVGKFTWVPGVTKTWQGPALNAAWGTSAMARAVELLDRTWVDWDAGWTTDYLDACTRVFEPPIVAMQDDAFLNGYRGWMNNWHTVENEAMITLAVLRDDRAAFDHQVGIFKRLIDGRTMPADNAAGYVSDAYVIWDPAFLRSSEDRGAGTEDCRDAWHSAVGLFSLYHTAQIGSIQGIDLWGYQPAGDPGTEPLLQAALERQARFVREAWQDGAVSMTEYDVEGNDGGAIQFLSQCHYPRPNYCTPDELAAANPKCDGTNNWKYSVGSWELPYRHFSKTAALPETRAVLEQIGIEGTTFGWGLGTLTHSMR